MYGHRFALTAAAALLLSTAAAAEPGKAPAPADKQPTQLAQADMKMLVPAKADEAAPVKRRAARVTSCRCAEVAAAAQPQN